jgi:hypothetical protein
MFSTSSEISRAVRCDVPFTSIPAARPATPSFPFGSPRTPARNPACTATTGTARFSRTITRIPFPRTSFTTVRFLSAVAAGAVASLYASRAIVRTSSAGRTPPCPAGRTAETVRFAGERYFFATAWMSSAVTARILRRYVRSNAASFSVVS